MTLAKVVAQQIVTLRTMSLARKQPAALGPGLPHAAWSRTLPYAPM